MLPNHERIKKALRFGIEVRMGEIGPDGERGYRVVMGEDGKGNEVLAIVARRERNGQPDEEVLLALDESVFAVWARTMTPEELLCVGAAAVLREMANERR